MRLINPGPGEMADRLSILALKIAHGLDAGREVAHFQNERAALLVKLRASPLDGSLEHVLDLATVNGMLWHAEDEIRHYRGPQPLSGEFLRTQATTPWLAEVVEIAFRIQALNDRRAQLVAALNKAAGSDLGPEKL